MRHSPLLAFLAATLVPLSGAFGQFSGSFNAQPGIDLSGAWRPAPHEESTGNPAIADFLGVPITEAARAVGLAWSPSRVTVPEHQCQVHVAPYIMGGPLNLRVWEERDGQAQKLIAIHLYISTYEQNRIIWMDGRPHPPEAAAHTWMGFSTGEWEGNTLTVYTTHIKAGYLRRNGLPESDQATLIEHFMRHGDFLVHLSEVTDPANLTEPFVRSEVFQRVSAEGQNWLYPCESVVEIANQPRGAVPNFLPGQNPFVSEFARKHGLPLAATLGGAETMYPEFQRKMKELSPPEK
ncbi:MAG TPA: hypothetical protein VMH80_05375 [Bryobacteraceae bacterium]|nr:hypothetical protein [Bryobacteraceae bacterium]